MRPEHSAVLCASSHRRSHARATRRSRRDLAGIGRRAPAMPSEEMPTCDVLAMCAVPVAPCAFALLTIASLTDSARNCHVDAVPSAQAAHALWRQGARACDMVSDPTSAMPTPPVTARIVGPAPLRNAACAPASSAPSMIGLKGNMCSRYCTVAKCAHSVWRGGHGAALHVSSGAPAGAACPAWPCAAD